MAECRALSAAMRGVLPLRDTVQAIGKGLQIDESCLTTFHTTTWEDNMGALTLANLDPRVVRPAQLETKQKFKKSGPCMFLANNILIF